MGPMSILYSREHARYRPRSRALLRHSGGKQRVHPSLQTAASHSVRHYPEINRLEDLLGQRLFVKTVPPLELTLEGEIVLGYAFRLLELNREMVTRVSKSNAMTTIRLGVIFPTLATWIEPFRGDMQKPPTWRRQYG